METLGNAFLVTLAVLVHVVIGIVYIPLAIAYYILAGAFTITVFVFCGLLVLVYKFAAWLSRTLR